jgi:hypothetical protein
MVAKALAALESHPGGFFLMAEGGMIDQAGHAKDLPRNIHETLEFSRAVQVALTWAAGRTDTLIVVTADHETGGLTVTKDNGPGQYPSVTWSTTGHTAANVPVFAKGVGAEQVYGVLDNTDIYRICTGKTIPVTVPLVAEGSTWKYEASGTDLKTAWLSPSYNDGSWLSGPAKLGYGDGGEKTLIASSPVRSCYYFRHAFTVIDPANYSNLGLRIIKDDGAVVYLNGNEVARLNMPTGTITYGMWASSASEYSWEALMIGNYLVPGRNVLAVEVHQGNSTSSDLALDLELTAEYSVIDQTAPVIAAVAASQVTANSAVIAWTTDEPADSWVEYQPAGGSVITVGSAELVREHSVLLSNLAGNTLYNFVVISEDGSGNESRSASASFTTSGSNQPANSERSLDSHLGGPAKS